MEKTGILQCAQEYNYLVEKVNVNLKSLKTELVSIDFTDFLLVILQEGYLSMCTKFLISYGEKCQSNLKSLKTGGRVRVCFFMYLFLSMKRRCVLFNAHIHIHIVMS